MILISAGHSITDPGACANGVQEAKLATELRDLVSDELARLGVNHITDGQPGQNLPLNDAIQLAKDCRIALEIHFNAASSAATGVECIALPASKALAQKLSGAVSATLNARLRGDHGYITQEQSDRGKLGFVGAGGLILEVGFVTNAADLKTYTLSKRHVAKAIAATLANE